MPLIKTIPWLPQAAVSFVLIFGFLPALSVEAGPSNIDKPRLIVLTDIGNEPDDSQSMVRLLVYANELDIEGLIATTSTHMQSETHRELIEQRVNAYDEVLSNLSKHASGYPDASMLRDRIRSGSASYGMSGVGGGKDTEASKLIIDAVDRQDARPVWVSIWGGAADLAQALWTVRATRSPAEIERFVAKLRVYSISDQDDAGPWTRAEFPRLFWITSVHAFGDYELSTWIGMMSSGQGADQTKVSMPWLNEHIRNQGALGALYPRIMFGMEGDTPSFLYLIPNGLAASEHPDWGSWGGRYGKIADFLGLWTSTSDSVVGVNGTIYSNAQATIWRWRDAFQNDFAARMHWSVASRFKDGNHRPQLKLNGSAGLAPVEITACAGEEIHLSAQGSKDPDGNTLTYRWWWYREISGRRAPALRLSSADSVDTMVVVPLWKQYGDTPPTYQLHVILEVTDNGAPALTSYRRAIISIPTKGDMVVNGVRCPAIPVVAQHPLGLGASTSTYVK